MKKLCLIIFCLLLPLMQIGRNNRLVGSSFLPYKFDIVESNDDTIHGIDVSYHQKNIKWSKIENIHFTFIKATEGKSFKDSKFDQNWDSAKKVNIIRGAYHFYRPNVSPRDQFINFTSSVKLEEGDLPPVLDAEVYSKNTKKLKGDFKKWLQLIENHYNVVPIIYCSSGYYKKYFTDTCFKKYPFWIANYIVSDIDEVHDNWHFWQYTCYGKITGISTYVDKNVFNGPHDLLLSLCKK